MPEDTVECVSVEGRATLLRDPALIDPWIERYLAKYAGEAVTADFLRQNAFFEVVPAAGLRDHRAGGRVQQPRHPLALAPVAVIPIRVFRASECLVQGLPASNTPMRPNTRMGEPL